MRILSPPVLVGERICRVVSPIASGVGGGAARARRTRGGPHDGSVGALGRCPGLDACERRAVRPATGGQSRRRETPQRQSPQDLFWQLEVSAWSFCGCRHPRAERSTRAHERDRVVRYVCPASKTHRKSILDDCSGGLTHRLTPIHVLPMRSRSQLRLLATGAVVVLCAPGRSSRTPWRRGRGRLRSGYDSRCRMALTRHATPQSTSAIRAVPVPPRRSSQGARPLRSHPTPLPTR